MTPTASLVIATKNRKDELRRALHSAVHQTSELEILVIDDGSTDETSDVVKADFPQVSLHRFEDSKGLIVRRNAGARLAKNEIIFSIDDDAEFSSPTVVEQTLGEFGHPRVAAAAIPFFNVGTAEPIQQRAPNDSTIWVTAAFIGTAHAIRRQVFLKLGGYREELVHQGEENDLCIRMLDAGYVVRLGGSDPIWHHESTKRNKARMDLYGRRNDILFAWQNVPWPDLPLHLAGTSFNGIMTGMRLRRPMRMLRGALRGYVEIIGGQHRRRPVARQTYRLHRELKKKGPRKLEDIQSKLLPLDSVGIESPAS